METLGQPQRLTPAARAVLDAAAELFYERGIGAVGVDAIAEAAGVTKKTIYDRFRSKSAVVCAYLSERDQKYRSWVQAQLGMAEGAASPLAVFDALDSWLAAHGQKGCAFVHAHAELLGEPEHPAHAIINEQKQWLHQKFTELVDQDHPAGAENLAEQLLALHEGATVLRSTAAFPHAVTHARQAADQLLQQRRL